MSLFNQPCTHLTEGLFASSFNVKVN